MILPDRMQTAAWLDDQRFCALPWVCMELLRRLQHVCDKNGRFKANAAVIRMALYVHERGRVSEKDVKGWLEKIRSTGLIRLWTQSGCEIGEISIWKQKLTYGKSIYEDEPEQAEMPLLADPPPKRRKTPAIGRIEEKRIEGEGARGAPRQPPAPILGIAVSSDPEAAVDALCQRWPGIDVRRELAKALARKRKTEGASSVVDLAWFERYWLPGCGPGWGGVSAAQTTQQDDQDDGPEGWREILKAAYPGNIVTKEGRPWADVPENIKAELFNAEMTGVKHRVG